jgi:predicted amidophosphoribosyltransferase
MSGCQSCGGFGAHHDPTVHDEDVPENERCDRCGRRLAFDDNGAYDICDDCFLNTNGEEWR